MAYHETSGIDVIAPRLGRFLCFTVLTLGLSGQANAATKINEARLVMRDYGGCLVSYYDQPLVGDRERPSNKSINAFLATDPMTDEAGRLGNALNTSVCLGGRNGQEYESLKFAPDLLRGAIFRAKYLRLAKDTGQLTVFAPYNADAPWHLQHSSSCAILQAIGECIVRENPAQARVAITTVAGSQEESAAYTLLTPSISRCLPRNGTYTFSRARLEGIMAEALYFLSGGSLHKPEGEKGGANK